MALGLVGRKLGMTRVFTPDGVSIPVSVIEIQPNRISQVKTVENDGYSAIQVTVGVRKSSRVNKPTAGHLAKAGVAAGTGSWEFTVDSSAVAGFAVGGEVKVDLFASVVKVDVTGQTIGKGYAGGIKRHHFSMQDATHGNSRAHRAPGSIGQRQTPGRVFKGKKMAGQLGNVQRTVQSLDVVRVDAERCLLLVKGAIPGASGGHVVVRAAVKTRS